ncbi:hypothetical protein OIE68_09265 [Nocardia vinacea]|uniref:hypothetical protein n=1 Tax=Nocardia vinacea TaxID=96468 RepID=UPI002E0D1334|nr:hypothetical protein OIE68_09265 [Nocardia vinacea]
MTINEDLVDAVVDLVKSGSPSPSVLIPKTEHAKGQRGSAVSRFRLAVLGGAIVLLIAG